MKKILIIDYDQNSLTSLQQVFSGQGYQVVTAADGQAGWDKYNKESPDLVLMEAMLPRVHGFELCQRITSERNSQATVFIMTGVYKDRVYRTEALRTYGASEYFEKPLKMSELLASVEAVLGKPEPKPAEARPVAAPPAPQPPAQAVARPSAAVDPAPAVATAPAAPAEARRVERPKVNDRIFDMPADLDRLSKDLPKARRTAPGPSAEPKPDAVAEELLKSVLVESAAAKIVKAKPAGGNGNGNNGNGAGPDIDQFLKSALAGFDLNKEKVKAAKPATPAPAPVKTAVPETKPAHVPPAPAPMPAAPAKEKPAPAPVKAAVPETKPAPAPPAPKPVPATIAPVAAPATTDMKSTLTPGDPGSDVSPFFVPDKTKPAAKPVERTETSRHEPARREPERREPPKAAAQAPAPAPLSAAPPLPERSEPSFVPSSGIFGDIAAPKEKKGFPKVLCVVLGLAAVGAVAFILLRPKPQAPPQPEQQPAQTVTQEEVAPPPVKEEAPAPKPAPKKAQPQNKPVDTSASAILPVETSAPALPLPGAKNGPGDAAQTSQGSNPSGQAQAAPKTEETAAPASKTETDPSLNAANQTASTADAGTVAASPSAAPAAGPVNTGDLVELGSVTEQPRLIKRIDPIYPQTAQRVRREGSITVNALIDEKGNVIDTTILKGIQDDKGLAKAAETAVRKWKFQPALKNGVAVKVWKSFVIAFKAEANPAN